MKAAPKFNTITAADWQRAIARGRSEGNAVLDQIRAAVKRLNSKPVKTGK